LSRLNQVHPPVSLRSVFRYSSRSSVSEQHLMGPSMSVRYGVGYMYVGLYQVHILVVDCLGILHALASANNTLWARLCLSVCRVFRRNKATRTTWGHCWDTLLQGPVPLNRGYQQSDLLTSPPVKNAFVLVLPICVYLPHGLFLSDFQIKMNAYLMPLCVLHAPPTSSFMS
jgi:hypothetical protein